MPRQGNPLQAYALIGGLSILMIAFFIGAGIYGRQMLVGSAIDSYYNQTYTPLQIDAAAVGSPPAESHLADVPWFSTGELLGPVSALRMVAARQGTAVADAEVSFLMGYTYGARQYTGLVLYPFTDAEAGHVAAAPALGLQRQYYTTGVADLYLRAIRQEIARGRAVYVSLDRASLVGGKGPVPHGVLIVGYEAGRVYYYETTCAAPAPCQAGERAPGDRGLPLADNTLVADVGSWSVTAQYPWKYGYSVFVPGPKTPDPAAALRRNGQLLASQLTSGPIQGARAVETVADLLGRSPDRADFDVLLIGLEAAAPARRASAAYLRATFPGNSAATGAADKLESAATGYAAALDALRAGRTATAASAAASRLREAAAADRAAGELLNPSP